MSSRAAASKHAQESSGGNAKPAGYEGELQAEIMAAVLTAAGELGYRELVVDDVLGRYGEQGARLQQRFAGKEDCFAAAHEIWMDRLTTEALTAALAAGEWRRGIRAAIVALFEFAEERPQVAKALLVEATVAGGAALAKREEAIERLGTAIDAARDQADPDQAPPPFTGTFVAAGIASYATEQLAADRVATIWEGLPELMRFAVGPYFGEEAAEEEFELAQALIREPFRPSASSPYAPSRTPRS